jgi:hypothetical protein
MLRGQLPGGWTDTQGIPMRNRIVGAIGVLWGGGMLYQGLTKGVSGQGAYAAGQTAAYVFGALMLIVGIYYFLKGGRAGK